MLGCTGRLTLRHLAYDPESDTETWHETLLLGVSVQDAAAVFVGKTGAESRCVLKVRIPKALCRDYHGSGEDAQEPEDDREDGATGAPKGLPAEKDAPADAVRSADGGEKNGGWTVHPEDVAVYRGESYTVCAVHDNLDRRVNPHLYLELRGTSG